MHPHFLRHAIGELSRPRLQIKLRALHWMMTCSCQKTLQNWLPLHTTYKQITSKCDDGDVEEPCKSAVVHTWRHTARPQTVQRLACVREENSGWSSGRSCFRTSVGFKLGFSVQSLCQACCRDFLQQQESCSASSAISCPSNKRSASSGMCTWNFCMSAWPPGRKVLSGSSAP